MPVFSFVTALVSPSVISVVESSSDDHPKVFFDRIIRKCGGLTFSFAGDEMCEIQGDWHSLISVHEILEKVESAGNISCVDALQIPDISKDDTDTSLEEPDIKGMSGGTIDDAKNVMHEIETVFKEYSDIDDNSIDLNEWHGNHGMFDDMQLNHSEPDAAENMMVGEFKREIKEEEVEIVESDHSAVSSDEETFTEMRDVDDDDVGNDEVVGLISIGTINGIEHNNVFPCQVCDFVAKSPKKLRTHMKKLHLEKNHMCLECGESFIAYKDLRKHMKTHPKTKAYSCEVCHKQFKYIRSLEKHTKKHYANEVGAEITAVETITTKPVLMPEPVPEKSVESTFEELFPKVEEDEVHSIKVDDFDDEEENEDNCYIEVLDSNEQDEFKPNHIDTQAFQFGASATATFQGSETLRAHLLADHEEYPCLKCGKVFKQAKTLKAHSLTHSDEARFPCPVCQKAFKQQSHLRRHSLIHTGERPYPCNVCGKKFRDSSVLRRHVKGVHKMSISVVRELTRIKKN